MQEKSLLNKDENPDQDKQKNNDGMFEDMEGYDEVDGMGKTRFKDDDEKLDLLKDIRKK